MNNLPIFGIVGRALWFVVANIFTLFRLTWVPIGALVATSWALAYALAYCNIGTTLEEVSDSVTFQAATLTELLLQGLTLSVVAVQVHRIILFGERRPNEYFAFPFGRTELLYVLMGALTFALLLTLLLVFVAGFFAAFAALTGGDLSRVLSTLNFGSDKSDPSESMSPLTVAGVSVAFVVGYVLIVWVMLRLAVWPPAVVANNKLALGEALRLSKRRVWALLGLFIASSLAIVPLVSAAAFWTYRTGNTGVADYFALATFETKVVHALGGPLEPELLLVEFAFQLLVTTYTVAILSYAYKALKGFDADIPIDRQSGEPADDPTLHMKPFGAA